MLRRLDQALGKKNNKRAKMALNRSPKFKGVIVQILCAVEIQFEFAHKL